MKIEDLTICPAWMDCFIAKKNKNGTMSVQRKALSDREMLEVIAFYGSNRLENGYKQEIPLSDGTMVVLVHTDKDNVVTTDRKKWHPTAEQISRLESLVALVEDEWGEYEDNICEELIENVKKLAEL